LLAYLEQEGYYIAVDEAYIRDINGNKTDRIIIAIAWWSPEQQRQSRRFMPRRLAESDATFNTNEKRLLLQNVIGIDNTGKTFPSMQLFHLSESARAFRFIQHIWSTYIFYDCPGPAVWCGDFAAGLSSAIAQLAAEDAAAASKTAEEAASKGKEVSRAKSPDTLQMDDPLPTAPLYEADSQTIIVDWVAQVEETAPAHDGSRIILQRCEWHAVEAIKKKLIKKGYSKEKREKLVDLIWKYIKAPDFKTLNTARQKLKDDLRDAEKEYFTSYYEPKEQSFCRAFTRRYPNLGVHSTQRNERYHFTASEGLSKNLPVQRAIEIICKRINYLGKEYDTRVNKDRITTPRLIDKDFFQLCIRRFTHFCLEMAMVELAQAKRMLDDLENKEEGFEFDPEVGCQTSCELPLQQGIPCKCWMAHFYLNDLPLPPNLFDPRWLLDGPAVLHGNWEMKLDNPDYNQSTILEERYASDRFAGRGAQLIIDTALLMAEKHKNLPPEEAAKFALTFKEFSDKLANRQDEKLKSREAIPARLPDAQLPPKLKFGPGRKRALTGREAADQQEADEARARRKAERLAQQAQEAEDLIGEAAQLRSQFQAEIAAAYFNQVTGLQGASDNEDEWVDIDDFPFNSESLKAPSKARNPRIQLIPVSKSQAIWDAMQLRPENTQVETEYQYSSQQKSQIPSIDGGYILSDLESQEQEQLEPQFLLNDAAESNSSERSDLEEDYIANVVDGNDYNSSSLTNPFFDLFPSIAKICSPSPANTTAIAPPSPPTRPQRMRKSTAKQASQNRRDEEARLQKEAKRKKKPILEDISQLMDLPFRSSQ
jgi:hypothetical protein